MNFLISRRGLWLGANAFHGTFTVSGEANSRIFIGHLSRYLCLVQGGDGRREIRFIEPVSTVIAMIGFAMRGSKKSLCTNEELQVASTQCIFSSYSLWKLQFKTYI
jgi:hypothetical protein